MPILFIYSCECAFFSLLIGAYFSSVIFGFTILGLTGISLYALFQRFYSSLIFIWMVTLLAGIASFAWLSELDNFLGTEYISIFSTICICTLCFISNKLLFKNYII